MKEWERFLAEKEKVFGKSVTDKWLRSLKVVKYDACNLYLEASDSFQISWYEEHIKPSVANELVNTNGHKIKIHLNSLIPKKKKPAASGLPSFSFDQLDDSCTFDHWIPSSENEASLQIVKQILNEHINGKPTFNPLYLYGKTSSGKTHILMSTARYLKDQGYSVAYVRAETFTSHVVSAIRLGSMKEFRKVYRSVDALIIDDVHVFSRKYATGEELFHTFNELHASGKPIILASRFPPSLLEEIEDRLVSRFEWGILLHFYPLSKEELAKLSKEKSRELGLNLSEKSLQFLTNTFTSTPSILRAINALVLRTHINPLKELTIENLPILLKDLIEKEKKIQITPLKIIQKVGENYGIPSSDILGKSQSRECALPRQVAMHLCRDILQMSFPQIGYLFSRDHTTVMASVKRIVKSIEKRDPTLLQSLIEIQKSLEKNSSYTQTD